MNRYDIANEALMQQAKQQASIFNSINGAWRQQQREADVDRGEIQMTQSTDGVYRRA